MNNNNMDLEQGFPDDEIEVPQTTSLIQQSNDNISFGGISSSSQGSSLLGQISSTALSSIMGSASTLTSNGCTCKHPVAAFFHIFFKVAALLCYYFLSLFTDNFVLVFVTCILLLTFDFWTVKNITGRLMVGLRWWNEVQPDGTSVWKFESKEDMSDIDPMDSYIFWIALYAQPLLWILAVVVCFIRWKFQWLMVIGFALVLGVSNAIGYFKCQRDATSRLSGWFVRQGFIQSILFKMIGGR
jgi:hypothetical protein